MSSQSDHHPLEYVIVGAVIALGGRWLGGTIGSIAYVLGGIMFLGGSVQLVFWLLGRAVRSIWR